MNLLSEQIRITLQNTIELVINKSGQVKQAIENLNKKPVAFGEAYGLGTSLQIGHSNYGSEL